MLSMGGKWQLGCEKIKKDQCSVFVRKRFNLCCVSLQSACFEVTHLYHKLLGPNAEFVKLYLQTTAISAHSIRTAAGLLVNLYIIR